MAPPPKKIADLLGKLAGLVGGVEDLVVEDGEVERQTEADGMRRLHLGFRNFKGLLISLLRIVQHGCSAVSYSNFGKVPVIIAFHLQVKHLGLSITGLGNKVLV